MPDASGVSPASDFSFALLTSFVRRGVRDIVLSPGSRSQALALVAAELEGAGAVRLHVRIDERVAGFLALGLAVESRMPPLVITTSGTATANLHPAVLEAHHSGVPIILLTADRPTELRGIRANQTTVQPGLYGQAVRLCEDVPAPVGDAGEADVAAELASRALDAALGTRSRDPGPVQLNLAFREPLSSVLPELVAPLPELAEVRVRLLSVPELAEEADNGHPSVTIPRGPRTVVIAGHGAGPGAEELAHLGGWPLIAEVSSGARFGRNLIVAYRELLAAPEFGGRIERAIVFGHPTLSREIPEVLTRDDVETIVVAPTGAEFYNPGRRVGQAVGAVSIDPDPPPPDDAHAWLGGWVLTSRALRDEADAAAGPDHTPPDVDASRSHVPADRIAFARTEFAAVRAPITRDMLVEALWRFTWPHDRLVFGASRLVRDADRAVPGKKIRVHANRGLAGIDGTVSTAIGIALASQTPTDSNGAAPGVTRVLLGDLTLLHDVGALLFGEGEARPNIQVIVGNDGGGTIFDSLEVAFTAPAAAFDRVMLTAQRADVASLASAYGWSYTRATTHGELDQALSSPAAGPSIVEVPLER